MLVKLQFFIIATVFIKFKCFSSPSKVNSVNWIHLTTQQVFIIHHNFILFEFLLHILPQICFKIIVPNVRYVDAISANGNGMQQEAARAVKIFISVQLKKWIGKYCKRKQLNGFTYFLFDFMHDLLNNRHWYFFFILAQKLFPTIALA